MLKKPWHPISGQFSFPIDFSVFSSGQLKNFCPSEHEHEYGCKDIFLMNLFFTRSLWSLPQTVGRTLCPQDFFNHPAFREIRRKRDDLWQPFQFRVLMAGLATFFGLPPPRSRILDPQPNLVCAADSRRTLITAVYTFCRSPLPSLPNIHLASADSLSWVQSENWNQPKSEFSVRKKREHRH